MKKHIYKIKVINGFQDYERTIEGYYYKSNLAIYNNSGWWQINELFEGYCLFQSFRNKKDAIKVCDIIIELIPNGDIRNVLKMGTKKRIKLQNRILNKIGV